MFKSIFLFVFFAVVCADPNEEFVECCKRKNVPDTCLQYCTYDTPSARRFFAFKPKFDEECGTNEEVVASLIQCAQKEKDNRECCKKGGVGNNYDYCLDLCDGTKPLPADAKYGNCQTDEIKKTVKECGKNA